MSHYVKKVPIMSFFQLSQLPKIKVKDLVETLKEQIRDGGSIDAAVVIGLAQKTPTNYIEWNLLIGLCEMGIDKFQGSNKALVNEYQKIKQWFEDNPKTAT